MESGLSGHALEEVGPSHLAGEEQHAHLIMEPSPTLHSSNCPSSSQLSSCLSSALKTRKLSGSKPTSSTATRCRLDVTHTYTLGAAAATSAPRPPTVPSSMGRPSVAAATLLPSSLNVAYLIWVAPGATMVTISMPSSADSSFTSLP